MTDRAVAIVGAGTAGLVAALSLARRGLASTVLERAPRLEEVGAGLQLSPNALAVLDRLGLAGSVRASAVAADAVRLRDARTDRLLAAVPVRSERGEGYLALHRADLQRALLDAVHAELLVDLRLGAPVEAFEGDALRLGDGSALRPALTVAADGVHSVLARALALPPAAPTGTSAVRFALDAPSEPAAGIEAWLAAGRHAVSYPVRGGCRLNLVVIVPDGRADDGADALAHGFCPRLAALIRSGERVGAWPILDVADGSRPSRPGLVFIGDAAHAMPPYAAQGAAMAIEDGFLLARQLASAPSLDEGVRRFEAERAPRLQRVRRRVAFHRFVYHLPRPFSLGRDAAMRLTPPERLRAGLSWLYDWRPPAGG